MIPSRFVSTILVALFSLVIAEDDEDEEAAAMTRVAGVGLVDEEEPCSALRTAANGYTPPQPIPNTNRHAANHR